MFEAKSGSRRAIGLGCMRLSTLRDRNDERSVAVIHAALDAGATLLDTADAYCLDDSEIGHNERLIARALQGWSGDRSAITVATKGGMRRPNGAWVSDGRAKHLREACAASREALQVDAIDLYQLHAVDPRTPIATSVRVLARLREEGAVRAVGLCNVTVSQIEAARTIAEVFSVQNSLSPFDDESLRNGVAEYCRDNGILFIAHRPLGGGGPKVKSLARNAAVTAIAAKHGVSNEVVALAWLMSFPGVVPIPGATRLATAESLARVLEIDLDDGDRAALDAAFPAGPLLRVPRAARRAPDDADGDVVLVMGMPGAGKSQVALELEAQGYARLNRDNIGGSLADLGPRLDELLASGQRRVVLDNTYPTRRSRNEVIETAWQRGVPVRCVWLTTDVADAQINSILRMIEAHGSLPTPEQIRERSKSDGRYFLPDAQFRYERTLEPPTADEGFKSLESRAFARQSTNASARALIFDFDDLIGGDTPVVRPSDVTISGTRREMLERYRSDGWLVFAHAWRPQVARKETTMAAVDACFDRMREVGGTMDLACCPHDAGPPACWCRRPIPGSVVEFAMRRGVSLARSVVIGASAADRTLAERIGARYEPSSSFFAAVTAG